MGNPLVFYKVVVFLTFFNRSAKFFFNKELYITGYEDA